VGGMLELSASEPPRLKVESAAMSSARMSNTCCLGGKEDGVSIGMMTPGFVGCRGIGDCGEGRGTQYLWHGIIIDLDQVAGRRVDPESLVEGDSRFEEGVR
jgi:hypothetical protein